MFKKPVISVTALAVALAGCSTLPQPKDDGAMQREALAGTEKAAPVAPPVAAVGPQDAAVAPAQITSGTGQFVQPVGLAKPKPVAQGQGTVTFNFENQPVESVVKAILGDLLHENYSIVPGVQGNVSFSTSQPVTAEQALPILETLLSWTGNALVRTNGRYVVMPSKDAVPGNVIPSIGATAPAGGLQARLFPLHYISATEMQKLIKPFARPDATLLADPTRNVIVMAGTASELDNYSRTVKTFDVDWLRGMSVGVFSLQRAEVKDLTPKLDAIFGDKGNTPMAGMLRFIPIERTNSLVVISPQAQYLEEVRGWIDRIDRGGGNEPQLFVYDVRNVQAADLADYLSDIYGGGSNGGGGDRGGRVGPGLSSGTLGGGDSDLGNRGGSGLGSTTGAFGNSSSSGSSLLNTSNNGTGSTGFGSNGMTGSSGSSFGSGYSNGTSGDGLGDDSSGQRQHRGGITTDDGVRITSVDNNNQLMVRARPSQWAEIEQAIKRLDVVPLQVQIETRILEVNLTGEFQFGVQWYLEGLVGGTDGSIGQPGNNQKWALGDGGNSFHQGSDTFFYSFVNNNLSVALRAMETNGNTKTLSAPSLVVLNNQKAHISVGDQIPIQQTYINTNSNTDNQIGQVEYKDTGVILNVRPRVNPGGLVYMNINQVVSAPGQKDTTTQNFPIQQREVATQVAVQSGQTVLLGGLIKQQDNTTDTGIPGLNRIPIFGRLFGSTNRGRNRTELIVLITPKVISNTQEAKDVTDEYQQKFESLRPFRPVTAPGTARIDKNEPIVTVPLK
ncbi:type II secretion system secretin GspD [Luteibacter yeojuensis]|uniref:General secretion pathway protein GspD n=1 Tax=Luteibacter yeojuensis TaxID=345309 RepID=A0A0F3KR86_9GAMM|nr:type II secretion system secretin GspD [Luteibacter yeojuensis]KJV33775.1 general secretion pathway protein GspD [Luteibacter yeojuensis]